MVKNEPLPILSPDEVDEYESSEAGEWISMGLTPERRAEVEALARHTLRELRQTVSISLSAYDLSRLEAKAATQGIDTRDLIEGILREAAA